MNTGRCEYAALAIGLMDALDVSVPEMLNHCEGCRLIGEARQLCDVVHSPELLAGLDLVIACLDSGSLHDLHCLQLLRNSYPGLTVVALFDVAQDQVMARQTITTVLFDTLRHRGFGVADPEGPGPRYPVFREHERRVDPESLGYTLTPRQKDVLARIRKGLSNKHIARELNLSDGTVKLHCMAIFRALGVTNRTQAAILADRFLLEDEDCTSPATRSAMGS